MPGVSIPSPFQSPTIGRSLGMPPLAVGLLRPSGGTPSLGMSNVPVRKRPARVGVAPIHAQRKWERARGEVSVVEHLPELVDLSHVRSGVDGSLPSVSPCEPV